MMKSFEQYSPCIYYAETTCENCEQHNRCDMETGRVLHKNAYESGAKSITSTIPTKEIEDALYWVQDALENAELSHVEFDRTHKCKKKLKAFLDAVRDV